MDKGWIETTMEIETSIALDVSASSVYPHLGLSNRYSKHIKKRRNTFFYITYVLYLTAFNYLHPPLLRHNSWARQKLEKYFHFTYNDEHDYDTVEFKPEYASHKFFLHLLSLISKRIWNECYKVTVGYVFPPTCGKYPSFEKQVQWTNEIVSKIGSNTFFAACYVDEEWMLWNAQRFQRLIGSRPQIKQNDRKRVIAERIVDVLANRFAFFIL